MTILGERKPALLLFNPFVYLAGVEALVLGLAAIVLAGFLGFLSHTHFDGVLDTHIGAAAPLWLHLAEGLIDWLCLGIVLLGLGRAASKTSFRSIDLLGTQALARWPTLLTCLFALSPGFQRFNSRLIGQLTQPGSQFTVNTPDGWLFLAVMLSLLPLFCWMIALMYKSFSLCCNLRGAKAVGLFVVGLVAGEVLSKLALLPLLNRA